ncbi:hypothetical protein ACFLSQ_05680 [Bacteroidota bacterium]
MKIIILILTVVIFAGFISCKENSLNIEDNVLKTLLTDTTEKTPDTEEIITKFRADSITMVFVEKIVWINERDTTFPRWNPLLINTDAVIDTGNKPFRLQMNIMAQRRQELDSISKYRKEHVIGFQLNLDSFSILEEYESNKNTDIYQSKIHIQLLPEKNMKTYFDDYPITIIFHKSEIEKKVLSLSGRFTIDVPVEHQEKKYDYYFIGEFTMRFPLE